MRYQRTNRPPTVTQTAFSMSFVLNGLRTCPVYGQTQTCVMLTRNERYRLLQGFKKRDEIIDLIGFELELWHTGMPGYDPFSQGFLKRLDGIALVQVPKWRCNPKWAGTHLVNRVTSCAIKQRQASTLLDIGGFYAL